MAGGAEEHDAEDRRLDRLGGLVDPVRRALYRFVAASSALVSRDEAAEAAGVSSR